MRSKPPENKKGAVSGAFFITKHLINNY